MAAKNPFLEAALYYRSLNWSVFPLVPRIKIPHKDFEVTPWREKLADENQIKQWWAKWPESNIGVVTGKLSNLFVVDLDKYKPEYSEETATQYFPDSIVTPTDRSARGGEHLYYRYPSDSEPTIHSDALPGVDYRGEGGYVMAPPSVFEGKAASWIIKPDEVPFADAPAKFLTLIKEASYKKDKYLLYTREDGKQQLKDVNNVNIRYLFSHEGRRDQDIFHVANMLFKGGADVEEIRNILNILAQCCEPPFPEREVASKIESVLKRASRKTRNISQEVRDWSLLNEGVFLLKDCYSELKFVNSEDQLTARVTLTKMAKEGLIEKYGTLRGQYRTKKEDAPVIDIFSADLSPYLLRLPLGVHEWVNIHKSNVIIVAGESNSGKTAFCLNVARMNRDDHNVNYLSNEMQDGTELRIRLNGFDEPIEKWRPVIFRFRTDSFPDVIDPDGLNIVDYLDEGQDGEAYKMTARIKEISNRLRDGIAVIAIQKHSQKQYGFGGEGTKNAARLYLSITNQNMIKIEKAKIWRNKEINPNGMYCMFRLGGGCIFKREGDWIK